MKRSLPRWRCQRSFGGNHKTNGRGGVSVICLLGLVTTAWAQGPEMAVPGSGASRIELAFSAGLAAPWGSVGAGDNRLFNYDGDSVSAAVSQAGRFGLEAEVRAWRGLFLGLDGGTALLSSRTQFTPAHEGFTGQSGISSGSAHAYRVGVHARYRLWPETRGTPWLGLGVGYEWLSFSSSNSTIGGPTPYVSQTSLGGWELARLLLGWDYRIASWLAVGPAFEASIGFFDRAQGLTLRGKAKHGWFCAGLRLVFVPFATSPETREAP